MYTYNIFIFGHDLSRDEKLHDDVSECDIVFKSKMIGGLRFDFRTHYHGGSYKTPIAIGHEITDNDNNPNFIGEVRGAKEETYSAAYEKWLDEIIQELEEDKKLVNERRFGEVTDRLIAFLRTKPGFYELEVSS